MEVGNKCADGVFSLRAAAVIIDGDRILLAKSDDHDCFYTVGSGIHLHETSCEAALRECYEETGCLWEIDRLVFIQERFYSVENMQHHEIAFYYLMKKSDFEILNGRNTDRKNEHLYWVPIKELETMNIVPSFLTTAVK